MLKKVRQLLSYSGATNRRRPPVVLMAAALIVVGALQLSGCGYSGEGEYQADGIWPLRNYRLELPEFPFESGVSRRFEISGYSSHGTSLLTLTIEAPDNYDFSTLDALVDVQLRHSYVDHFHKRSALNAHLVDMRIAGAWQEASPEQWRCRYVYTSREINQQAWPFSLTVPVQLTRALKCSHFIPTGRSDYDLTVNIANVPDVLEGATASVELASGWK